MVQPLAEDLFRGFSCAFVCCGQNGSGKSYTIEGGESQETKGVVDRLVDYMAFKFETPEQSERTNLLRVSYVDIY